MSTVEVCKVHDRGYCWKCSQDRVFDLERQLAEAHHVLEMDDPRLLQAVQTIARLVTERDEAQGKLGAVREQAERHIDARYTGSQYLAGMNAAGRDIIRILDGTKEDE